MRPQAEQGELEVPPAQPSLEKLLWVYPGQALALVLWRYGEIKFPHQDAPVTPRSAAPGHYRL